MQLGELYLEVKLEEILLSLLSMVTFMFASRFGIIFAFTIAFDYGWRFEEIFPFIYVVVLEADISEIAQVNTVSYLVALFILCAIFFGYAYFLRGKSIQSILIDALLLGVFMQIVQLFTFLIMFILDGQHYISVWVYPLATVIGALAIIVYYQYTRFKFLDFR